MNYKTIFFGGADFDMSSRFSEYCCYSAIIMKHNTGKNIIASLLKAIICFTTLFDRL